MTNAIKSPQTRHGIDLSREERKSALALEVDRVVFNLCMMNLRVSESRSRVSVLNIEGEAGSWIGHHMWCRTLRINGHIVRVILVDTLSLLRWL